MRLELSGLFSSLDPLERKFQKLKRPTGRIEVAEAIIERCHKIIAIEAHQIFVFGYDEILPSQWLSQYQGERDWAIVDSVSREFEKRWTTRGVNLKEVLELAEKSKGLLHDPTKIAPLEQHIRKELSA